MQQFLVIITSWLGGFGTCLLFFQYTLPDCLFQSVPSHLTPHFYPKTNSSSLQEVSQPEKPILLVWAWPETDNFKFDPIECKNRFGIDSCNLTDDRNLYTLSDAVLIYHKSIKNDLSSLPQTPRPSFQRWIWFNLESPTNTRKKAGLENLFNLTLTYRRDSDISVRYDLTVRKRKYENIVIPKKDKLVCWFVSNTNPGTGAWARIKYYEDLRKHINVSIFGNMAGSRLKDEDYYPTMASCKFYLSFENSIHKDYITEKFNGPLAVGTVPIVLGTSRENYEQFAPGDSFIHVNDFPSAELLAQHLFRLDKDDEAYRHYFDWRKHISTIPHYSVWNEEFILPICQACDYIARHREYKEVHDLFKWYFS
ncbi:4-galactosyl-N-acetylglucosaminide 3-alpha-L-fucosyltransferase 9-like [Salminus brasiliensis]|uniref:4-galactosyl-N-acetylglucosaminide 3-alpha-L-fucosyltransferase 9-like n=1 Tax=Salminus brasiliensis TaxID=930266 RepID=UPI003B839395